MKRLLVLLCLSLPLLAQLQTTYNQIQWDSGLLANMPTSCSEPAAYYATDTTTLYVCNKSHVFVTGSAPGGLGAVALTGTPSSGQVPTATSSTAAIWKSPVAAQSTYAPTLNTSTGAVTCDYTLVNGVLPTCVIVDSGVLNSSTPISVSFTNLPTASGTAPVRLGIIFSTSRLKQVTWPTSAPLCWIQEQDYAVPCQSTLNFWGMTSPNVSISSGPALSMIWHGVTYDGTSIWPDRTDGQFQSITAAHMNTTNLGVGLFSQQAQGLVAGAINAIAGSAINLTQASYIHWAAVTVASLPACGSTVPAGTMLVVSDATSPTYNATVAGSGAVTIPVLCDGTNWKDR
jgi:hypothetical protein